jgi:hypothetical protein
MLCGFLWRVAVVHSVYLAQTEQLKFQNCHFDNKNSSVYRKPCPLRLFGQYGPQGWRMTTATYSPLLKRMPLTCTAWVVDCRSQTMGVRLSPAQTTAKVKYKLHSQWLYGVVQAMRRERQKLAYIYKAGLRYLTVKNVRIQLRCLNLGDN